MIPSKWRNIWGWWIRVVYKDGLNKCFLPPHEFCSHWKCLCLLAIDTVYIYIYIIQYVTWYLQFRNLPPGHKEDSLFMIAVASTISRFSVDDSVLILSFSGDLGEVWAFPAMPKLWRFTVIGETWCSMTTKLRPEAKISTGQRFFFGHGPKCWGTVALGLMIYFQWLDQSRQSGWTWLNHDGSDLDLWEILLPLWNDTQMPLWKMWTSLSQGYRTRLLELGMLVKRT